MKTFLNYLGQLRIYSFLDLVLLLVALHAGLYDFLGVVFLHIGFLAYLENQHSHSYRKKVPKWFGYLVTGLGIFFYRDVEAILFLVCSFYYVKKTEDSWGWSGPLFRGLQYFFLVGGIVGYINPITWIAFTLIFIRNFAGDLRDVEKDISEGMKTLPIILGFKKDVKYVHLITTLITSLIWIIFAKIPLFIIPLVVFVQIITYKITPR